MKLSIVAGACALAVAAVPAHSAVVINVLQVGANVQMTLSGSLNTTGATLIAPNVTRSQNGAVFSAADRLDLGGAGPYQGFSGLVSPADTSIFFGNITVNANVSSGSAFELRGTQGRVYLPRPYVSGAALSASNTYNGRTLAQLGLAEGSATFSLTAGGTGTVLDTIRVNVGAQAAAVPEPATWAMMIVGFDLLGARMRARRPAAVEPAA